MAGIFDCEEIRSAVEYRFDADVDRLCMFAGRRSANSRIIRSSTDVSIEFFTFAFAGKFPPSAIYGNYNSLRIQYDDMLRQRIDHGLIEFYTLLQRGLRRPQSLFIDLRRRQTINLRIQTLPVRFAIATNNSNGSTGLLRCI